MIMKLSSGLAIRLGILSLITCFNSSIGSAVTVSSWAELNNAIVDANQANTSTTIQITSGFIDTPQFITPLGIDTNFNQLNGCAITIDGQNNTINPAGAFRGFFVGGNPYDNSGNANSSSSAILQNLIISSATAQGGNAQNGGAGAGLGGGLFVHTNTSVTLENVTIENSQAKGGSSSSGAAYGGGGMGGNCLSGGGGGGFNQAASGLNGGGCSFTAAQAGGYGTSTFNTAGAGGGPNGGTNGGNGGDAVSGGGGGPTGGDRGGAGGGVNAGQGGYDQNGGAAGGAAGLGGGAGGSGFVSAGGGGGYVGGGGGSSDLGNVGGPGGGGFGGGGGSGNGTAAGAGGGFGGGGGGGTANTLGAGNYGGGGGGFGGGGGAAPVSGAVGGNGGFGGGGGGGPGTNIGKGGFGAGNGGNSPSYIGGGGFGAGGAAFIHYGGTLNVKSLTLNSNAVTAGSGANAGSAAGADFFLMSGGSLNFNLTQDLACSVIAGNASQGGFSATASSGVTINNNSGITLTFTTPGGLYTGALFDGVFKLNGGNCSIDSDHCLGASAVSPLVNGGNLITSQNISSARNFSIGSNGATFSPATGTTFTLTGILTGADGATLALAGPGSTAFNQVAVNNTDNFIITGIISGAQSLTKTGTGKLVLNGSHSYTGDTVLSAGQLQIGDALHTGASVANNLSAATGTTVSGHGTIHGNLSSVGATVAPGGSIGTLVVGGAFTADSGTTLQIELSPTQASLLQVTGSATLNGGNLTLDFDAGSYSAATYNILTASSVTGMFTTVIKNNFPTNITSTINYLNNAIQLVLTSINHSFGNRATTELGKRVGDFMDILTVDSPTTAQQQLITALNNISSNSALNNGLEQIPPPSQQGLSVLTVHTHQQQQVNNRLASLEKNHYFAGDYGSEDGIWLQPFYNAGKQQTNNTMVGYNEDTAGFLIGADRQLSRKTLLGIAASYAKTKQKSLSSSLNQTKVDNYLGMLYGALQLQQQLQFNWQLAVGRNNYAGVKTISLSPVNVSSTAKYWGYQYSAQGVLSKRFAVNQLYLSPIVSGNYVYLHQRSYSDQGAGTLAMSVAKNNSSVVTLGAGLKIDAPNSWSKSSIDPEVHALAYYDLKSAKQNVSSTFVSGGPSLTTTAIPGRVTGQLGAALVVNLSDRLSCKAGYDLLLKNKYYNNSGFVLLKYLF
jgi:uncharacterized protein with beta-barrel porin domain